MTNQLHFPNGESFNEVEYIRSVQRYLRELSRFDESIPMVPIDGEYGAETQNAVAEFQRKHGLPPTGIVDRDTWTRLYFEYSEMLRINAPPLMLDIFPHYPQSFEVGPGDESFLVSIIQYILRELAPEFDLDAKIEITGIYDEETESAVRQFQHINMLEETGRVNKPTWNRLVAHHNRIQYEYYQ